MSAAPFRWRHLILLSGAVMLTVSLETLPAGILPAMAEGLGQPTSAIGRLVSVWGFTVILTSIPLARLVGRWDRRAVTAACLAITGVCSLATALAPSYGIALATRVLAGAGHGVFWALVVVYAAALAPARYLAAGIALVTGGSQLAAAITIPAAAGAVGALGWRWIYAGLAAAAVVVAGCVRLWLPPDQPASAGHGRRGAWREPGLAGPLALAVVALLFVFAHFLVYTYATVYFSDGGGGVDPRLSLYLAVIGAASIAGLVISGPLANRWPRYGLVAYLLIFAAGMVLIVPLSPGARLSGLALWGLMFGTIGPVAQAVAIRFSPLAARPTVSAAMVVTFNLGISLGAFAGGAVVDAGNARISPLLAAGALLLAAGVAWWAGGKLRDAPRALPA